MVVQGSGGSSTIQEATSSALGSKGSKRQHNNEQRTLRKEGREKRSWCYYCHWSNHNKARCWKLHGRPQKNN